MKKSIILLFIPSVLFSDCRVQDALITLRPGSEWRKKGTDYNDIVWLDSSTVKPTQQEILDSISACQASDTARKAQKSQARLDVKNNALTQAQRLQAILILLDFDR